MTEQEQERSQKLHESYRREYETLAASWRFLISLRFLLAGFSATLQSGLFTLFYNVFKEKSQNLRITPPLSGDIENIGMCIISLAGFLIILGVMLIEFRTMQVFRDLIKRGVHLEYLLGMGYGHFCVPTLNGGYHGIANTRTSS